MNRIVATVINPDGTAVQRVMQPNVVYPMSVQSEFLASPGQDVPFRLMATVLPTPDTMPGEHLVDARAVTMAQRPISPINPYGEPLVWAGRTHQESVVPTTRPLWEVLSEAVQHGLDYPSHGSNCACMDALIWELRQQMEKAVPIRTLDTMTNPEAWEREFDGRNRIRIILDRLAKGL